MKASQTQLDDLLKQAKQIFGDLVIDVIDYDVPEGSGPSVSLIVSPDTGFTEDGITLMFENGNRVRISTSEWTNIQNVPKAD